ncbi:hypothetical protein [Geodermatophilus poikilotrophus]|uniref:hypothetical protein n=1 Tax=Geodermatophilus poikilotrophus TaxID=1333667 RepID=UPI00111449B0|nr:hypothetical protein [Geodermatophilus poikilotrophus]
MEDIEVCECSGQDLEWHGYIHEAAHAVAAVDNDIRFECIYLYAEGAGPSVNGGLSRVTAEAKMPSEDPATWVLPDTATSFRFCAAGTLAEEQLIGHGMYGAYDKDVEYWLKGAGRLGAITAAEFHALIGGSADDVAASIMAWASCNEERIERLAAHLATLSRPTEVSYDEVVSLVGRN